MAHSNSHQVILATGLQSSGSSLVSWCFLQRADTDGVLDGDTDIVPVIPGGISAPVRWYKTTISSFTLQDQVACLEDAGHSVRPLLIVRDVRTVWASLAAKHYGRNGITAEDPPLRLRFRRFLESWEYAREHQFPIISFEQFLEQPEKMLRQCCNELSLPWDDGMVSWPKQQEALADTRHGNATFRASSKGDLLSAIGVPEKSRATGVIPVEDLNWLDDHFAEFNQDMGYPRHLDGVETVPGRSVPSWDVSRRKKWRLRQKPFRYLFSKLKWINYDSRPE